MRFSATNAGFAAGAVAAVVIGIVLFGVSGHGAPDPGAGTRAPAMSVPVVSVVTRTVPVWLDYVGTTEAIRSVTLQAQVTGYLAARGARCRLFAWDIFGVLDIDDTFSGSVFIDLKNKWPRTDVIIDLLIRRRFRHALWHNERRH